MGRLVAFALVGNLLLASGAAAVFWPVETSRTALDAYDGLPDWLREILGDSAASTSDGESRSVGSDRSRGPIGDWLADLYLAALAGDRSAQRDLPLVLQTDVAEGAWTSVDKIEVSWMSFDSGFTYRVAVTATANAPDLASDALMETDASTVEVPVTEGPTWIHVQTVDGDRLGPVATAGPFHVDRSPPAAPHFLGGTVQTVADYHYSVAWSPVHDDAPVVAYHLERSPDGTRWSPVSTFDADVTEHQERNQPNGVYRYRVRAENAAGLLSLPSPMLVLTVDAQANLQPPAFGAWHYGINATYDSVIHLWDLSDSSRYLTLDDLSPAASPAHGGLTPEQHARYTAPGWGIELADLGLCEEAAAVLGGQCAFDAGEAGTTNDDRYHILGGERNTLEIGIRLFAWLFDATDYDFEKFNDPEGQNFLKATETLNRGAGICGDLTALYLTVMRMAGVPARPVHGYLENDQDGIGGFHMWAEIYVGGDDPVGGGWLPVDVSGVTGAYDPKYLPIYFGIANPSYLQLGIQEDLGDPDLDRDDPRARWNVWANMQYTYYKQDSGGTPDLGWEADATVHPVTVSTGRLWFDPDSRERVFCEGTGRCGADHLLQYYDEVRGRSVRSIDYGARLVFEDGEIEELTLKLKFPEKTAASQVALYTVYERDATCTGRASAPAELDSGSLEWTISGRRAPCSA